MKLPGIDEKVAFLSRPEVYPGRVQHVEIKQTHMSWVFLTDTHAWKLKRPVQTDFVDFSTPEARRRNCLREVRLNRRLAPDVYFGVVPLTIGKSGELQLASPGKAADWLVSMRRLPLDRMLDALIACHAVTEADLATLASTLVAFFKNAQPVSLTGAAYRKQLTEDLRSAQVELAGIDLGLNRDLVNSIIGSQLEFLRTSPAVFDSRIATRKVVEAHGDLRPEHICLEPEPVVIDCLEFNRNLRILDVASELMFLALECERLDAGEVGEFILRGYCEQSGDHPPVELLAFYKAYHACIRARIAIWHLKDEDVRSQNKWIDRANRYLHIVTGFSKAA